MDKVSCIYKITNIINDKCYIGSSVSGLGRRKINHLFYLRNNSHHSIKLQNAFNKYGEENFTFKVLEKCSKENIIEREQYWIDKFNSYNKGYNSNPKAANCFGRILKKETKIKISNTLKGRKVNRSEEHQKNLGISRRKKVVHYDLTGNILNIYDSCTIAAKELNIPQSKVSFICINKNSNNLILRYV